MPGLADGALKAQRDVVAHVLANLQREPGIRTIGLGGSLARGTADAYSDVDLTVRVDATCMRDVWRHRHRIVAIPRVPVLDLDHQWGDPAVVSYAALYETGVYLDLTFMEGEGLAAPEAVLLWSSPGPNPDQSPPGDARVDIHTDPFEDALHMFWIGSPLCAKYLVRHELWTAHWFLESRRAAFLKAWRLVHAPSRVEWGWSKVHEDMPASVLDLLAATVTPLEYAQMAQALLNLTALMTRHGPELADAYGGSYPNAAASTVAAMVSRMLASG